MTPPPDAAWTLAIPPESATGDLVPLYAAIRSRASHGTVGHVWQALGADPAALETLFHGLRALLDEPAPLTAGQAEMVAVVVSATNGCGYCVSHHGPRLAKALGDEALARAVALDYREADLPARDRVLLDFAVAVTCEPAERTASDLERLREYGFGEPEILRATALTGYFNHVNRVVSALGVALEAGREAWTFGDQR